MTGVCGVCGALCPTAFRVPPAELAPDLDGRPGEPARSTLKRWVATCRSCGAAAPDLAALPLEAGAIVRSPAYAAEPSPFLRWAMICDARGDRAAQAEAVLQAAWRAEDDGADAAPLRRRAAALWQGDALRLIDILRRAGAFDPARAAIAALGQLDEAAARIVDFERKRIDAGDAARYAISSALRPPARTPHVAHGPKKPSPGFLGRLFGR